MASMLYYIFSCTHTLIYYLSLYSNPVCSGVGDDGGDHAVEFCPVWTWLEGPPSYITSVSYPIGGSIAQGR
jgi:hypothetical protein